MFKQSLSIIFFRAILVIFKALVLIFIALKLGPKAQGGYAFFLAIVTFASQLSRSGIDVGHIFYHKESTNDVNHSAFLVILTSIVSSTVVASFAYFIFISNTEIQYQLSTEKIAIFLFVACIATALRLHQKNLLLNKDQINYYNILGYFQFLTILATIFIFKDSEYILEYIIIAYAVGVCIDASVGFILVAPYARLNKSSKIHDSYKIIYKNIKIGLPSILSIVFLILIIKIDILMLSYLTSQIEVGIYSFSALVSEKTFFITEFLYLFIYKKILSNNQKKNFTTKLMTIITPLVFISAIILISASHFLIPNYAIEYTKSISLITILSLSGVFLSIYHVLHAHFTATNKIYTSLVICFSSLIINIFLNIVLIPQYGLYGAAYGTLVAYASLTLTGIYFFYRNTENSHG